MSLKFGPSASASTQKRIETSIEVASPWNMTAGFLWVISRGSIVQIDPQTNQAVETIPLGGHPIDVEIAGDAVWVSIQGPNKVLRINS